MRNFMLSYGFILVVALIFIGFSLSTGSFLTLGNIIEMIHGAVPMLILASGLALVVMTGNIDISVGSLTFVTAALGSVLMVRHGVPPAIAIPVIIAAGASCGALNGFIVSILKVNSFIATLGTLFALRGIALLLTRARVISMPEVLRGLGHTRIGPVFADILIALGFVFFVYFLHARTSFGRHLVATGGEAEVAKRMGVRVLRVTFLAFLLSGLFASIGGIFSILQLGAVTLHMGRGLEFTAIAAIVIGGISLFGGRGSIIPGVLLGVITLAIIENGLIHLGASPYAYPFVRGGIIFIAMYADSLKSRVFRG
jgi:ribose/xylose/arabinose/galactoside ABC-type transport system permease subunit